MKSSRNIGIAETANLRRLTFQESATFPIAAGNSDLHIVITNHQSIVYFYFM
jgi:hypothetical protein